MQKQMMELIQIFLQYQASDVVDDTSPQLGGRFRY